MTMVAYTTKIDLTKYGSYFMMALIGLVIAMVLNMFIGSGPLDYIISAVGVLLFTALIAYDTQKLHKMAQNPELHGNADGATLMTKVSIIGALRLYLDFVNLFLFLLRIFGGRR
jgi:FtsH-binding integral membrane protein